jgi:hypothetical protein
LLDIFHSTSKKDLANSDQICAFITFVLLLRRYFKGFIYKIKFMPLLNQYTEQRSGISLLGGVLYDEPVSGYNWLSEIYVVTSCLINYQYWTA